MQQHRQSIEAAGRCRDVEIGDVFIDRGTIRLRMSLEVLRNVVDPVVDHAMCISGYGATRGTKSGSSRNSIINGRRRLLSPASLHMHAVYV